MFKDREKPKDPNQQSFLGSDEAFVSASICVMQAM